VGDNNIFDIRFDSSPSGFRFGIRTGYFHKDCEFSFILPARPPRLVDAPHTQTLMCFPPATVVSIIFLRIQWASSEASARLALQAEGKLDKPVFGVHYDTPENKFDFESVNPDNPLNEGRSIVLILTRLMVHLLSHLRLLH
jgi:hypothetical protein